jgi:hypothetical protein
VGIRCADHTAPSIRESWHYLRRQAAVARSVYLFVLFVTNSVFDESRPVTFLSLGYLFNDSFSNRSDVGSMIGSLMDMELLVE